MALRITWSRMKFASTVSLSLAQPALSRLSVCLADFQKKTTRFYSSTYD